MGLTEEILGARVVALLDAGGVTGLVLIDQRGDVWHTLRLSECGAPQIGLVRLSPTPGVVIVPVVDARQREQAIDVPVVRRPLPLPESYCEGPPRLPSLAELPARTGRPREEREPRACLQCGGPVLRRESKFCQRACWPAPRKGKPPPYVETRLRAEADNFAAEDIKPTNGLEAAPTKTSWPATGADLCVRGVHQWEVEAMPGGVDRYHCLRPGCTASKEQREAPPLSWKGKRDALFAKEVSDDRP